MAEEPFDLPPDVFARIPLFAELARVLSWDAGPINWDLARQFAVAIAGRVDAPAIGPAESESVAQAVRTAELWLAEATGLPTATTLAKTEALTPASWAEGAPDAYRDILDPLAARITGAVESALPSAGAPAETAALHEAIRRMSPLFLGIQAGVVLGWLAGEIRSPYDLPFPRGDEGRASIVLSAVDTLAGGYGLDGREALLWTSLHESAHRLQFETLTWVRAHFFALYHNYVAALDVDLTGALERLGQVDITNPEQIQSLLGEEGLFGLADTPGVGEARDHLHRFLSLLEAYADRAVSAAASRLPDAPRIAEAAARSRAEESTGERLFRQFSGLELRPSGRRGADEFIGAVLDRAGWPALNRLWEEPDALPSADELTNPDEWLGRTASPEGNR